MYGRDSYANEQLPISYRAVRVSEPFLLIYTKHFFSPSGSTKQTPQSNIGGVHCWTLQSGIKVNLNTVLFAFGPIAIPLKSHLFDKVVNETAQQGIRAALIQH